MEIRPARRIGIMADSHSRNQNLTAAIRALQTLGADEIVHLGDICDSLKPESLDQAIALLECHQVKAVLGNNEYSILADGPAGKISVEAREYLRRLPYLITMGDLCFTHSLPFAWPAATRRPLTDFLPHIPTSPYRILFRGHSHTPSVIALIGNEVRETILPDHDGVFLDGSTSYIITAGALENGGFVLLDTDTEHLQFLSL